MVLYGAKREVYGQKAIDSKECPKCGGTTYVMTNLYMKWHMFFVIPIAPVQSSTIVVCAGCQKKRYPLKRFNKKFQLGLSKSDMKAIKKELNEEVPPEAAKKLKIWNVFGTISMWIMIIFLLFILLIVVPNS